MSSNDRPRYFTGLDLGGTDDFTAVAVLERTRQADETGRSLYHHAVRHLERFPPGTPYAEVFAWLAERFRQAPLTGSTLVVDQTAVGKPVLDLLRRAKIEARLVRVALTIGHRSCPDGVGGWQLPRKELVGLLQVLLQSQRLRVAPALTEAGLLVQELMSFRAKVSLAPDAVESWREGAHDDLVLAVAIAAWEADRNNGCNVFIPEVVEPGRWWAW